MGLIPQSITVLLRAINPLVKWPSCIFTENKNHFANGCLGGIWIQRPFQMQGLNCPIILFVALSHQHVVMELAY